jgi:hypothetical protein
MNPVDYAINRVMGSDIDDYLLKLAFENPNANYNGNWYNIQGATTVQQGIREQVIFRTVLPDCHVGGGKTEFVDLSGAKMMDKGNGCVEVNVPDIATGGRKIVSVNEVYLGSMTSATGMLGMGMNDGTDCGQGSISDMMQGMIDGLTPSRSMPHTYTNVHMTGNNSFVIFGLNSGTFSMTAKCILEYDQGMSSIHPRHYKFFANLVELAVKAYVYRKCRRATGEAVIRAGIPLQDIKDDIQAYSDCWTQYKEYFEGEWSRCMAWSDTQLVTDMTRMSVPRRM